MIKTRQKAPFLSSVIKITTMQYCRYKSTSKTSETCKMSTFFEDLYFLNPRSHLNQSSYLICFCYILFDSANEIKSNILRSQRLTCFIFLVLFSNRSRFYSRKQPFRKSIYSWERTIDGIEINDIGNFEDSASFMFIDEECQNLIVVNDGGELTRNIDHKKKSGVSQ